MNQELNGIVVIDKSTNMSSAKVVHFVKKILQVKKVGHSGTLDPQATGVLVCCINLATRLNRFFLKDNKKYYAVFQLGVETDTQDSTGNVIATCDNIDFNESTIRSVIKQFGGQIKQLPPIYSALKHKGVPLYKFARIGRPVQKPPRTICISYIKILKLNLPFVHLEIACSAGTYIRTICADIGKKMGCGGHLTELRRIENGGFTIENAITLTRLEEIVSSCRISDHIISMTDALKYMPKYVADEALTKKIFHGQTITKKDIEFTQINKKDKFLKIVDRNNNLIAIINYLKDSCKYKYCCVLKNNK